MKILITGSNGLLGQKIVNQLKKRNIEFLATSIGFNRNPNCPESKYQNLDITKPDSPKVMWGGPIVGGSGDFQELAQTWSKAQVAYINLRGYKDRPVLIFGAGYDTNKDNVIRTNDSKGRGVFIVDAETGKKIWALTPNENGFTGNHSIASDITVLDSDYDGYVDRLYATDTGGDIWRIDMPGEDSS